MGTRSGWGRQSALGWRRAALMALGLVAAIGAPNSAYADRGEVSLRLQTGNEGARLRHPGISYVGGSGDWFYVPRFGLGVSYGLAHWLSLGLGVNTSLSRDVSLHGATAQGYPPGNLNAGYLAFMVPISVEFQLVNGNPWTMLAVFSGGPAFTRWEARRLEDGAGMATVPLVPFQGWYTEWFGRVAVQAEWRSVDWGTLCFGPYVGMSNAHDIFLGIAVDGAFVWGFGRYVPSES